MYMSQGMNPSGRGVISSPETQTALWFLGVLSQVRVSGAQTGGAFSLTDNLARRGSASPVHIHEHEEESLIVLDGDLRVVLGDDEHLAGPGTVAVLPKGVPHAYVVTSAEARFLTLHNPVGFEQFAAEVGHPAEALTLPPEPAVPADLAAVTEIAARHGITILAPPPTP
jgi:quercetin dioxygenase-like cupin family protein